jgi:hypothetical protein
MTTRKSKDYKITAVTTPATPGMVIEEPYIYPKSRQVR